MTAFSRTHWTVACNHGGCGRQLRTEELGLREGAAADVRQVLRVRGWAVAVPAPNPQHKRRDYCPEHKGDAR